MLKKIIIISAVLFVGIIIGVVIAHRLSLNGNNEVVLKNYSSQNIKLLHLVHDNSPRFRQDIWLSDIKRGQTRKIEFVSEAESVYTLIVEFENGSKIEGGAGYIEGGYKITELITDTKITTDFGHKY